MNVFIAGCSESDTVKGLGFRVSGLGLLISPGRPMDVHDRLSTRPAGQVQEPSQPSHCQVNIEPQLFNHPKDQGAGKDFDPIDARCARPIESVLHDESRLRISGFGLGDSRPSSTGPIWKEWKERLQCELLRDPAFEALGLNK